MWFAGSPWVDDTIVRKSFSMNILTTICLLYRNNSLLPHRRDYDDFPVRDHSLSERKSKVVNNLGNKLFASQQQFCLRSRLTKSE